MEFEGKCSCIYCKEIKSIKGIFVHVDRAHLKSTKYSSGYNGCYKEITNRAIQKTNNNIDEYLKTPSYCECCGNILQYSKRFAKYCSHSCSARINNRKRIKKTEEATIGVCVCGKEFRYIKTNNRVKTYCSNSCGTKHSPSRKKRIDQQRSYRTSLANYRSDCKFKFNIKDFPLEFDFYLIEQHGWYKARNRGNNITGVSRDHMVSVRYGFNNNIDPKIISHPANCQLLPHSENSSKHMKCSITLEELKLRILNWDSKYK